MGAQGRIRELKSETRVNREMIADISLRLRASAGLARLRVLVLRRKIRVAEIEVRQLLGGLAFGKQEE